MQTIVLITRENSERATHVTVYLCGNYSEAKHFCHFVNRLSLAGGDKLAARIVTVNAEYSLEKYQPFSFDDLVKLDDRTMQCIMREMESRILALALKNAKNEVKDCFFRNISKRAAAMLKEDMEYMDPITESDIEDARQLVLDIYDDLIRSEENKFDEAWISYRELKGSSAKNQTDNNERNNIVLVFRGSGNAADRVSIYLFDEYRSADQFCYYLNELKPDKGFFFYARHADQIVEYETAKPLLVSFDKVFEFSRLHGERSGAFIIREALKRFSTDTLSRALFGLDKSSRMCILQNLPIKIKDEVNENIECYNKSNNCPLSLSDSREAQKKILNAINRTDDKFRQGKFPTDEIFKD
jgi:hypothetical protein